ncbi:hypothetical protein [Rhizorhabdus phycosphaerae]|uniref:hypothetical protein n=1 Tax=Rhizorhabdus phycosphaerae TaxID=2711156 RepID=UPI0013EC689D|nr:hypothetical protein [Rhizorhabdus phycosphaerae]
MIDDDMTSGLAGDEDVRPEMFGPDDDPAEADDFAEDEDHWSDDPEGGDEESAADGEGFDDDADAIEQVEYEGRVYEVPAPLKDALLRQADYTRKTMALAEQRRALAADRAALEQVQAMTAEELQASQRLHDIERQLDELAQHDWSTVDPGDPDLADLRRIVGELAQEQMALHHLLGQHSEAKSLREQQDSARAREETDAMMAREIRDWSPQRRQMLEGFAVALGIPDTHLGHASPAEMRVLNLAFLGAQQLERQRAANQGAFRPAAEVGGGAGSGPSDPSRMTMAQYRAWRAKQK